MRVVGYHIGGDKVGQVVAANSDGETCTDPQEALAFLLEPKPNDKVLEIGGGSGYQAAILSRLVKRVYAIELVPRLVSYAKANLRKTKCRNVEVIQGDGGDGYKENAPYDKIIITCATPRIYEAWKQQLKESGILLAPVGSSFVQTLTKGVIKNHRFVTVGILDCVFVPLKH